LQIDLLNKRLGKKNIKLDFTKEALDRITDSGFDPQFGARPLKRIIQKEIENQLAIEILEGRIMPGSVIKVDVIKEKFTFEQ